MPNESNGFPTATALVCSWRRQEIKRLVNDIAWMDRLKHKYRMNGGVYICASNIIMINEQLLRYYRSGEYEREVKPYAEWCAREYAYTENHKQLRDGRFDPYEEWTGITSDDGSEETRPGNGGHGAG